MMRRSPSLLAILLVATIIVPSVLFIAAPKTHAHGPVAVISDTSATSIFQLLRQTLTAANTYTSMVAQQALVFNAYVLQPLSFILSGNLLKARLVVCR